MAAAHEETPPAIKARGAQNILDDTFVEGTFHDAEYSDPRR